MKIFFEVSGVETSLWLPPLTAFVISFFTSMGGISGAFLLLPYQVSFLGYTSPSVSATNHVFNIVAIPSGVYRYFREGRIVWPLTCLVIIGTLPGVFIGIWIRIFYLPDPRNFKLFASIFLLYIALKLIYDLIIAERKKSNKAESEKKFQELLRSFAGKREISRVKIKKIDIFKLSYSFYQEEFKVNIWGVILLSLVVGIVGGIYGVGGGAIIAPFLVTFFALPVYTIAGATLMGTFVTSVTALIFYQLLSFYYPAHSIAPDWKLGLLFGIGGMLGMYTGARCQKYFPAKAIKWLLAALIMISALKYLSDFLM